MSFFHIKNVNAARGFTIVELIVSVTIFAFLTAFLVTKYGTFNQSVLLTNLAYDIALTLRNAQSYGLNVKSKPTDTAGFSSEFGLAYGVHFETSQTADSEGIQDRQKMIFFADVNGNKKYRPIGDPEADPQGELLQTFVLRNGSYISALCAGTSESSCTSTTKLDITFIRPDPEATFYNGTNSDKSIKYAEITVTTTGGTSRKVVVRRTGQIAVLNN